MSDPSVLALVVLLVALLELSPVVRMPIGLALATAMLATDTELLPIVAAGAIGAGLGRLVLALQARRGRDRRAAASPAARTQRDALRARLAASPAYARTTFMLALLPGVPSRLVFPLLGAMRVPLAPAVAGTVIGRLPILALTTSFFAWLGDVLAPGGGDPAFALGTFAAVLLLVRSVGLVDWQHRAGGGGWRLRDPDAAAMRMGSMFTGGAPGRPGGSTWPSSARAGQSSLGPDPSSGTIEGEVLDEELTGVDEDEVVVDDSDVEVELDPRDSTPSGDPSDPRS